MSKRNKKKSEGYFEEFRLHPETKKSIWAVIFFGVAAILILARFQNAGPFGNFLYRFFEKLFGWGYYLLPLIFLVLAGVFLASERRKIYQITSIGAVLFVISGLGLIDIIFPNNGGLAGNIIGVLEVPFGYVASIIISLIILVVSFLITLNLPIKIKMPQKSSEATPPLKISEAGVAPTPVSVAEQIAESKSESKTEEIQEKINGESLKRSKLVISKNLKGYVAPPLNLLKSSVEKPTAGDLRANANIIKRTLESFGIPATVRKRKGADIDAACGQLAGQVVDKSNRAQVIKVIRAAA